MRAQKYRMTPGAAGKAELVARDMAALWRELSMTLRDVLSSLSYRTWHYRGRHAATHPGRVDHRKPPTNTPTTRSDTPATTEAGSGERSREGETPGWRAA